MTTTLPHDNEQYAVSILIMYHSACVLYVIILSVMLVS